MQAPEEDKTLIGMRPYTCFISGETLKVLEVDESKTPKEILLRTFDLVIENDQFMLKEKKDSVAKVDWPTVGEGNIEISGECGWIIEEDQSTGKLPGVEVRISRQLTKKTVLFFF
jgi:hypothetical protein